MAIESEKANERILAGKSDPVQNSAQGRGKTRDAVAQALGTNRETLRQDQFIADNADLLDPADFANWDEGKLSTNKAYQRIGEILRELPTRRGARTDKTSVGTPTKVQAERDAGIDHHTAIDLQAMAANPDVVQAVIDKAEAEGRIPFAQVEREFDSRDAAKIWIIENQFKRRNLSKYDRSVLALQLEPLYAAEAKRRMLAGKSNPSQKSDEGTRTDEQLAKLAGVSRDTIDARESVKSGEKRPTVGIWVTPLAEEPPKYPCNLVQVYIIIMHISAAFMLFMHGSRKRQAHPRRSLVGGGPRKGWGVPQKLP